MDLEQALEKIAALESQVAGLEGEKKALLAKRDELLGEVKSLKSRYSKFAAFADKEIDLEELLEIKAKYEAGADSYKKDLESAYQRDKKLFEQRLQAIEKEREQERQQREQERAEAEKARLKAEAISEFSKEAYRIRSPEQFWRLFGEGAVRYSESGKLVVGDEYRQVSLSEYIEQLNEDPENAHHFKPKGGSGAGTTSGATAGGKAIVNPWKKETFNLTQQGQILRQNPELAARLEAEARGSR